VHWNEREQHPVELDFMTPASHKTPRGRGVKKKQNFRTFAPADAPAKSWAPLSDDVFRALFTAARSIREMIGPTFAAFKVIDEAVGKMPGDRDVGWSRNLLSQRTNPPKWSFQNAADLFKALRQCEWQRVLAAFARANQCTSEEMQRKIVAWLDGKESIRRPDGNPATNNDRPSYFGMTITVFLEYHSDPQVVAALMEAHAMLYGDQDANAQEIPGKDGRWTEQPAPMLYSRRCAPRIASALARRLVNRDLIAGKNDAKLARAFEALRDILSEPQFWAECTGDFVDREIVALFSDPPQPSAEIVDAIALLHEGFTDPNSVEALGVHDVPAPANPNTFLEHLEKSGMPWSARRRGETELSDLPTRKSRGIVYTVLRGPDAEE
jgi:hypothetical protein